MCVSAMVSCITCETSQFGASCSPTTSKSNFRLDLTNFVISSTDIFTNRAHIKTLQLAYYHREEINRVKTYSTYLAIHVPCDDAHTEHSVGSEFTHFLNWNCLYAIVSPTIIDRNKAFIL